MHQLQNDLDHVLRHTQSIWKGVRDKTIFVTGGTGFFGKWLLHSFDYVNGSLQLNNKLIVLTRDSASFLEKNPQFKSLSNIEFLIGDVMDFDFPTGPIDYIIHAATEASEALNQEQPMLMYDTIVEGTRRVLELGREKNVKAILHTSSGAVYGKQPPNISHISEEFQSCPDIFEANAAYGEGKRVAEMMSSIYYSKYGLPSKIARCFAFVGPYLPLDAHFAIGNFIENVLNNKDIFVNGDGSPYRSYLYASDLAIWLWVILFNGVPIQPYNVGSDESITIEQLAIKIAKYNPLSTVNIKLPKSIDKKPGRYVPLVDKAKNELGLKVNVGLEEAIAKTIAFYLCDKSVGKLSDFK